MDGHSWGWRGELARAVTDPADLPHLGLPAAALERIRRVSRVFPLRASLALLSLADLGDPRCPVRRQIIPDRRELLPGGEEDPLEEERFQVQAGVIRRFGDRLLALVSSRCPAHCRHCNRKRRWSSPGAIAGPEEIARAVSQSGGAREVILSGGEPLLRSDSALDGLLQACRSSAGVELVRIHSRAPCTLPSRITPGLVRVLRRHRPLWFVTHFNHQKELGRPAREALFRLGAAGIPLLNQAVLLRGVNDSLAALVGLGRALAASGVKPHYLFQLDRAVGTLHFQVPLRRALRLASRLRAGHSGLIVPHLLVDLPGRAGKVPITPSALIRIGDRGALLRTPEGGTVWYQEPR